jgi:hypothetical protein
MQAINDKAILRIGTVLAVVILLGGLILLIPDTTAAGPVVRAAVLISDFMFIALLALLQGIIDIRDLLKTLVARV